MLAGKFFHSVEEGQIVWQGEVLSRTEEGRYLVQLYEWTLGQPSVQKLVTEQQIESWIFYDNLQAWKDAGDNTAR